MVETTTAIVVSAVLFGVFILIWILSMVFCKCRESSNKSYAERRFTAEEERMIRQNSERRAKQYQLEYKLEGNVWSFSHSPNCSKLNSKYLKGFVMILAVTPYGKHMLYVIHFINWKWILNWIVLVKTSNGRVLHKSTAPVGFKMWKITL